MGCFDQEKDPSATRVIDLKTESTPFTWMAIGICVLAFMLGPLGNGTALYVLSKYRVWKPFELIFVTLSICDFMATLVGPPVQLFFLIHRPYSCDIVVTIITEFYMMDYIPTTSLILYLAISRVKALKADMISESSSKRITVVAIVVSYVSAIILCGFHYYQIMYAGAMDYTPGGFLLLFLVLLLFPPIFILSAYIRINRNLPKLKKTSQPKSLQVRRMRMRNRRVALMSCVIVVINFVSSMPGTVYIIYLYVTQQTLNDNLDVNEFCCCAWQIQMICNPFAYSIFNHDFREKLRELRETSAVLKMRWIEVLLRSLPPSGQSGETGTSDAKENSGAGGRSKNKSTDKRSKGDCSPGVCLEEAVVLVKELDQRPWVSGERRSVSFHAAAAAVAAADNIPAKMADEKETGVATGHVLATQSNLTVAINANERNDGVTDSEITSATPLSTNGVDDTEEHSLALDALFAANRPFANCQAICEESVITNSAMVLTGDF